MSEKRKYLFLTGNAKTVKEVQFENDDQAIEEAKKATGVIRVQCLSTLKHIHESAENIAKKAAASATLLLACLLLACGFDAQGATVIGVLPQSNVPIINLALGGTNTTQAYINTNQAWPNNIPAGQTITNITPFSVPLGTKYLTFQMNNQLNVAAAASTTNVIYQLGRSVQANSVTNALGTNNCNIEWFATITNTLPASAAANVTYTSTAEIGPNTGQTTGPGVPGYTTFYVYYIIPPANLALTNSQLYVNPTQ